MLLTYKHMLLLKYSQRKNIVWMSHQSLQSFWLTFDDNCTGHYIWISRTLSSINSISLLLTYIILISFLGAPKLLFAKGFQQRCSLGSVLPLTLFHVSIIDLCCTLALCQWFLSGGLWWFSLRLAEHSL